MVKLNTKKYIILGSQSPRRKELLKLMGFNFKTQKLNIREDYPKSLSPIQVALFLSKKKANAHKIKQDKRRKIRLVDPSFVEQFIEEFKKLISETAI